MNDNVPFIKHFTSILGILTDSFLDSLGLVDPNNVIRWTPNTNPNSSYIPSLADTIMKPGEEARRPSIGEINIQRRALDLPIQISSDDQLSCDYLGGGLVCGRPSLQHIAIQQTGAFLMAQKVINSMGMLANMGDDNGCLAGFVQYDDDQELSILITLTLGKQPLQKPLETDSLLHPSFLQSGLR